MSTARWHYCRKCHDIYRVCIGHCVSSQCTADFGQLLRAFPDQGLAEAIYLFGGRPALKTLAETL